MGFKGAKISQADWDLTRWVSAENSWLQKQNAHTVVLAFALIKGVVEAAALQAQELAAA